MIKEENDSQSRREQQLPELSYSMISDILQVAVGARCQFDLAELSLP